MILLWDFYLSLESSEFSLKEVSITDYKKGERSWYYHKQ